MVEWTVILLANFNCVMAKKETCCVMVHDWLWTNWSSMFLVEKLHFVDAPANGTVVVTVER